MDPLLTPVLDPFVQGIKQPFIVVSAQRAQQTFGCRCLLCTTGTRGFNISCGWGGDRIFCQSKGKGLEEAGWIAEQQGCP